MEKNNKGDIATWRNKPTILSKIDKKKNYIFTDESGYIEGINKLRNKIINHEDINLRDESIFLLNSVFIKGNRYDNYLLQINGIKKETFDDISIVLHSTDIHNKKGIFRKLSDYEISRHFYENLTHFLMKSKFIQMSTAINKKSYITNNLIKENLAKENLGMV